MDRNSAKHPLDTANRFASSPGMRRSEVIVQIFVRRIPGRIILLHLQRRTSGDQQQIQRRALRLLRLCGVLPRPSIPDRCESRPSPFFATCGLRPAICMGWHASGISASTKSGYVFTPHKRVHAAHRRAQNQPQMLHAQVLEQRTMRRHHVVIVILRKISCAAHRLASMISRARYHPAG